MFPTTETCLDLDQQALPAPTAAGCRPLVYTQVDVHSGMPSCTSEDLFNLQQPKKEPVEKKLISITELEMMLFYLHQSGTSRRYTCQVVEDNSMKVEAHYTPVFKGTSGGEADLYHRAGDDVVLPCNSRSRSSCSAVDWFYSSDPDTSYVYEVTGGKVVQSSRRAARLNVDSRCSLIITNITAEDAGRYACRPASGTSFYVFLSVLTISPSPPDADPTKEDFTLQCSLRRHSWWGSCPKISFHWLNETGTELTGEGGGYELTRPWRCVSSLTVQHQSGTSRRYTCQVVEGNTVKVEAHYTPLFKGPANNITTTIILGAAIGVLLLLVGLAAVFIKLRKTRVEEDHKTTTGSEDQDSNNENHHYDELQSNLTYATVNHPRTSQSIKVQRDEDTVTYSAVRMKEKTEADIRPSGLYGNITEPK
ncbi:uncharacterized protein FYW61_020589 [Anableps anableps]